MITGLLDFLFIWDVFEVVDRGSEIEFQLSEMKKTFFFIYMQLFLQFILHKFFQVLDRSVQIFYLRPR